MKDSQSVHDSVEGIMKEVDGIELREFENLAHLRSGGRHGTVIQEAKLPALIDFQSFYKKCMTIARDHKSCSQGEPRTRCQGEEIMEEEEEEEL